jgi:hypothetical protein
LAEPKAKAAERAREYRARRRAGLRLVRGWVPDHRSPENEARLAEQAAAISASGSERETLNWLEAVADRRGWVWQE